MAAFSRQTQQAAHERKKNEQHATPAGSLETIPVLPLRDIVVFPHMIVPLFVGREKSIKALEEVMREDKRILLVAQKNPADDDPASDAVYEVGTLAQVLQLLKLPDGTVKVLVEGSDRARVHGFSARTEFFEAEVEVLPADLGTPAETEALARTAVTQFDSYVKLNKKVPQEVLASVGQITDHSQARRHHRRASRHQDRREAGASRDDLRRRSGWRRSMR